MPFHFEGSSITVTGKAPNILRVIIADDHQAIRTHLRKLLEKSDEIQVIAEVEDGQKALDALMCMHADVLLLDVEMPHMNGLEVLERIRDQKISIRTLMVSSYADPEFVRCALELGAKGYIAKEDSPNCLAEAVCATYNNAHLTVLSQLVKTALAV